MINNSERKASWQSIAAEALSERDALKSDVLRMQQERDEVVIVASVMRTLAGSPRLQSMTVAAALDELQDNGVWDDSIVRTPIPYRSQA